MTVTHGHSCGTDRQKFACLHNKIRTTHPIFFNIFDVILQGQHSMGQISRIVHLIDVKLKG